MKTPATEQSAAVALMTPTEAIHALRTHYPKADGWAIRVECAVAQYEWCAEDLPAQFTISIWRDGDATHQIETATAEQFGDPLAELVARQIALAPAKSGADSPAAESFFADMLRQAWADVRDTEQLENA